MFNKQSSVSANTGTSRDEFVLLDDDHLTLGKYAAVDVFCCCTFFTHSFLLNHSLMEYLFHGHFQLDDTLTAICGLQELLCGLD